MKNPASSQSESRNKFCIRQVRCLKVFCRVGNDCASPNKPEPCSSQSRDTRASLRRTGVAPVAIQKFPFTFWWLPTSLRNTASGRLFKVRDRRDACPTAWFRLRACLKMACSPNPARSRRHPYHQEAQKAQTRYSLFLFVPSAVLSPNFIPCCEDFPRARRNPGTGE